MILSLLIKDKCNKIFNQELDVPLMNLWPFLLILPLVWKLLKIYCIKDRRTHKNYLDMASLEAEHFHVSILIPLVLYEHLTLQYG